MRPGFRIFLLVSGVALGVSAAPVTTPAPTTSASGAAAPAVATERVTLDQAIERALRRNPAAQSAAVALEHADALVCQARAASLLALSGNAIYTRLDHEREFAGRRFAARDQVNANLQLVVLLIAPGKWAQWSHAKDDAKVLGLSSEEVRR